MTHKPTEESRKTVYAMSSYGIPHTDISNVIGIDEKTLRKHYRQELDNANAETLTKVAGKLFDKCMEGDTTSLLFWMKTRGRWAETQKFENRQVDKDGNDVDMNITLNRIVHDAGNNDK